MLYDLGMDKVFLKMHNQVLYKYFGVFSSTRSSTPVRKCLTLSIIQVISNKHLSTL